MRELPPSAHIIISRLDNIGDVILTLPLAGLLKAHRPDCRISFIARDYVAATVRAHPSVDRFISWDELTTLARSQLGKQLSEFNADAILHVSPNRQLAKAAACARIPIRLGTSHRWYHHLYCRPTVAFSRKRSSLHEAQLNCALLAPLGLAVPGTTEALIPHLQLTHDWPRPAQLDAEHFNLIIHPGSNGHTVEWPAHAYRQVITALDPQHYTIFLTGSVAEAERFRAPLGDVAPAINLMGQTSLAELMAMIAHADGLIAGSTGPLHLAAALGKRCLGLYPPCPGKHPGRWAPIGQHAQTLSATQRCERCPKQKNCSIMGTIPAEKVVMITQHWRQGLG